ncbi:MAG: hypothetical protein KJ731_08115 [Alphaproteobacteria bacterium]|nr:hypothetical protein [Alphaproteobacteria bacterium]MBU1281510.1 hypothetical protein [Alphaproteobacteria bacterium]MBU1572389.1 hypothetical protein [Alphaproteobacteria bacterium]MBU1828425.1 hypothetical protein [Alphaproteobacteria bacterium]MBU2077930.1 hypothetical protein [Alphaproteobacteria bacterium]
MNKAPKTAFFRIVKRSAKTGSWITKEQNGASGRHVISVKPNTYKKGLDAATRVLKDKKLYEPTGS